MEIGIEKLERPHTSFVLRLLIPLTCGYGFYWLGHIAIFCVAREEGSYLAAIPGMLLGQYLVSTGQFHEPAQKRYPLGWLAILAGVTTPLVVVGGIIGFTCFGYFSPFQGDGNLELDCVKIALALGIVLGLRLSATL